MMVLLLLMLLLLLLLRLRLLGLVVVMMMRRLGLLLLRRRQRLLLRLMLMLDRSWWSTVMAGMRKGHCEGSMGVVGSAVGCTVTAAVGHCVRGRHVAIQARSLTIDGRSTLAGDKLCHHNLSS